jgi:phosphatidylserine decarboxylase
MIDNLFILFQHLVPQQWLSRLTGWLAELRHPAWLKDFVVGRFIAHFDVDMSEVEYPYPEHYANFNEFFTRPLREGVRPLADAAVVCPADGAISQLGQISQGRVFQAKGHSYTTRELLGGDELRASIYEDGHFATIYLSPRDYHRVHMPTDGVLTATTYVPGRLFSVNPLTASRVDRLFARNERLVCHFDTPLGPMAMVLVGAMIVAGIDTVWSGQAAPPPKKPVTRDFARPPATVELRQGQEMGRFRLGSTVILLFPRGAVRWDQRYGPESRTRLGEALAHRIAAD